MAWEDLEQDIAEEFSGLAGCYDLDDDRLTLSRRDKSAEHVAFLRAHRASRRAARRATEWQAKLESGELPSRCHEAGCHNLLSPAADRRPTNHCSESCQSGASRRQRKAEERARLLRLWDDAGTRLWRRQRSAGTAGASAGGGATGAHE